MGAENAQSITPYSSPLWVGCLAEITPSQSFAGVLDELAVWHRPLGPVEIGALATASVPLQ